MKSEWKRWGWRIVKWTLALAIVIGVGRQFYHDLNRPELVDIEFQPMWLVLAGLLYLPFLGVLEFFWYRLLLYFGQKPSGYLAFRAYFLSQLGKYVPGKAWALLMRGVLVRGPECRAGVAVIASLYEVFTSMAAGALLAGLVFFWQPPELPGFSWNPLWTSLVLLGLAGLPLLPFIFNFLVKQLANRFPLVDTYHLPQMTLGILLQGILITSVSWLILGFSLWVIMQGVLPSPPLLTVETWLRYVGIVGLGYVAGFLILVVPGGIGVREFFFLNLLQSDGPEGLIAAAVLLLRLVWTVGELVLIGLVAMIPGKSQPPLQNLTSGPK